MQKLILYNVANSRVPFLQEIKFFHISKVSAIKSFAVYSIFFVLLELYSHFQHEDKAFNIDFHLYSRNLHSLSYLLNFFSKMMPMMIVMMANHFFFGNFRLVEFLTYEKNIFVFK